MKKTNRQVKTPTNFFHMHDKNVSEHKNVHGQTYKNCKNKFFLNKRKCMNWAKTQIVFNIIYTMVKPKYNINPHYSVTQKTE